MHFIIQQVFNDIILKKSLGRLITEVTGPNQLRKHISLCVVWKMYFFKHVYQFPVWESAVALSRYR